MSTVSPLRSRPGDSEERGRVPGEDGAFRGEGIDGLANWGDRLGAVDEPSPFIKFGRCSTEVRGYDDDSSTSTMWVVVLRA